MQFARRRWKRGVRIYLRRTDGRCRGSRRISDGGRGLVPASTPFRLAHAGPQLFEARACRGDAARADYIPSSVKDFEGGGDV